MAYSNGGYMGRFAELRDLPFKYVSQHSRLVSAGIYLILFALYNAFWIGCIVRHVNNDLEFEWCDGIGFLTILTIIVYTG